MHPRWLWLLPGDQSRDPGATPVRTAGAHPSAGSPPSPSHFDQRPGLVIQTLVVASWHGGFQGDAFGCRMLIVGTPLFALGLASTLDRCTPLSRAILLGLVGLLVVLNLLLILQYRLELLDLGRALPLGELYRGRFGPWS